MRLAFHKDSFARNTAHNLSTAWLLNKRCKQKKTSCSNTFSMKGNKKNLHWNGNDEVKMQNSNEMYVLVWPSFFLSFALLVLLPASLLSFHLVWPVFRLRNVLVLCRCWECDGKCYMMYHHRLVCGKANKMAKFMERSAAMTHEWSGQSGIAKSSFFASNGITTRKINLRNRQDREKHSDNMSNEEMERVREKKRIDKQTNKDNQCEVHLPRARGHLLALTQKCWFRSKFRRKFDYSTECTIDWANIDFHRLVGPLLFSAIIKLRKFSDTQKPTADHTAPRRDIQSNKVQWKWWLQCHKFVIKLNFASSSSRSFSPSIG